MTVALVRKPLRHSPLIDAFNGPPDSRESDHIRGHVSQGNHWIANNGSKTASTGLSPKTSNHAGIPSTPDVRLGEFCPRRGDIRRLHLGVVVDEGQILRTLSHEAGQVMHEIGEDAIRHDGALLKVGGTKVDR